uniref:Uncharacterized protein n=1 Tax=Arundo donax TaxID=35708 RepID=A0A0A9G2S7_ARUDO
MINQGKKQNMSTIRTLIKASACTDGRVKQIHRIRGFPVLTMSLSHSIESKNQKAQASPGTA